MGQSSSDEMQPFHWNHSTCLKTQCSNFELSANGFCNAGGAASTVFVSFTRILVFAASTLRSTNLSKISPLPAKISTQTHSMQRSIPGASPTFNALCFWIFTLRDAALRGIGVVRHTHEWTVSPHFHWKYGFPHGFSIFFSQFLYSKTESNLTNWIFFLIYFIFRIRNF